MADTAPIPNTDLSVLGENPLMGDIINPNVFKPISFEPPKISPAVASPVPSGLGSLSAFPSKSEKPKSLEEAKEMFIQKLKTIPEWGQDKYSQAKPWTYDSDYTGAFLDRYKDIGRLYKKLGFSPYRNNEALYNAESTWTENHLRAVNSMFSLAGLSFKGALPWNAWDGEISLEDARKQERAFARGNDSKGGFGAFMNNQALNSGFTLGTLAEFGAESLAEWGIAAVAAPETGFASLGVAAVETAQGARKIWNIGETIGQTWKKLKSLEYARDIYNSAKQIPKALVPSTFDYAMELKKLGKAGHNLDAAAKLSKGVGALYKDMRTVNGAIAESKMEAGSVELRLRDQLTQEFVKKNNRTPSAEEYAKLYKDAASGGNETFWYNLPAIYFSNKIVFDKAFSTLKPLRNTREALSKGLKNWTIKEATPGVWEPVKKSLRKDVSEFFSAGWKSPKTLSKNLATGLFTYSKANITEGLQEQYQEAISEALTEYYREVEYNPLVSSMKASFFADALKKQFTTAQGWETFASGFMMGGMMQGPQKVFSKVADFAQSKIQPESYAEAKKQEEENLNKQVNALNEVSKFIREYTSGPEHDLAIQVRNVDWMNKAYQANDKKTYIDIQDESIGTHLYTLAQGGRLDLLEDQIKDYMQMTPEEMAQAFGMSKEDVEKSAESHQEKLQNMLQMVEQVKKRNEEQPENPFNPYRFDKEKQAELFEREMLRAKTFEHLRRIAVVSAFQYDRVLNRLTALYEASAIGPVKKASSSDFNILYGANADLESEIGLLGQEIKSLEETAADASSKALLKQKKAKYETLEKFYQARKNFENIHSITKGTATSEKVEKHKKALAISKGKLVTYTGKDGKTKSFTVSKTAGKYAYDPSGRRYLRSKLELSKKEDYDFSEDEIVESFTQELYESYTDYVAQLAKTKNEVPFHWEMRESFNRLTDYLRLNDDRYTLAMAIDWMNNPQNYLSLFDRMENLLGAFEQNKNEELKKALLNFKDMAGKNTTLNKLFDAGMFLDEEAIDLLKEGKDITTFFYNDGLGKVPKTSTDYQTARDIIDEYRIANNHTTAEAVAARKEKEEAVRKEAMREKEEGAPSPETKTEPVSETKTEEAAEAQVGLTPKTIEALKKLKFPKDVIDELTPENADVIIANNYTYGEYKDVLKKEEEEAIQERELREAARREKLAEDMLTKILAAPTKADLKALEPELEELGNLIDTETFILLSEKYEELLETLPLVTYNTLNNKDLVVVWVDNKKTIAEFIKYPEDNTFQLAIFVQGQKTKVDRNSGTIYPAEDVGSLILSKANREDMKTPVSKPVSQETKEQSNKNSAMLAKEEKKAFIEKAKSVSLKDAQKDFEDSIGCE